MGEMQAKDASGQDSKGIKNLAQMGWEWEVEKLHNKELPSLYRSPNIVNRWKKMENEIYSINNAQDIWHIIWTI